MVGVLFLVLSAFSGVIWAYPGKSDLIECPANTTYTKCDFSCQPSCAGLHYPQRCVKMCVPGCKCNEGLFSNGIRCVTEEECPKDGYCGENEYYGWGNNCDTCKGRRTLCPEVNSEGCYCDEGYVLDEGSSKCVPKEQCE